MLGKREGRNYDKSYRGSSYEKFFIAAEQLRAQSEGEVDTFNSTT